ncbi:hypothetical protein G5B31_01110 [Rhodobacter sp. SGA-6-6]|uniref:hypothetical protein n=1 Tax=Rhodobacter sp. SGA-6-6 TaxID=2710882 RepID=UPI0013ED9AB1|nr:hypothetical protein [Rhodobacter sp. SGA-6-6]NGM44128.1 hypothetical protein [Rhodobacter sp. SGA-6-6]
MRKFSREIRADFGSISAQKSTGRLRKSMKGEAFLRQQAKAAAAALRECSTGKGKT